MDPATSAIGDIALVRGREAAANWQWSAAREALSLADDSTVLLASDVELLAIATFLLGRASDSIEALQRAYELHIGAGEVPDAARCTFWLCFQLITGGDFGQAEGWLQRVGRIVEERGEEDVAQAYLLLPRAFQQVAIMGDFAGGRATAVQAAEQGRRFGDPDVVALALNIEGRAFLGESRVREGVAALDEAMVGVIGESVSAPVAGMVYCSVIEACTEISDLRRAQEWTAALSAWCDRQGGMVTFTGQCLVHRAAVRQLRGEWGEALEEAQRACERLAVSADRSATGAAMYQLGEVHRCRGDEVEADDAYRQASQWGYDPQPGLALLRLAQGRTDAAVAAVSRAVDETREPSRRAQLLTAYVAATLAADEVAAARRGADELMQLAELYETTALRAEACVAMGAVQVAEGDDRSALLALSEAVKLWRELDAPYHEARARTAFARACRAVGDEDTATLELDAARNVFDELGARPALADVESLLQQTAPPAPSGLSPRELEVLLLLATGKTNRMIADELMLAVRTVDRHVSSILTKLGVASRSAATAYAYEHHLVETSAG